MDEYFMENVYPVLTPMAVDSSRPFPLIVNKTLNLCALLKKKNEEGCRTGVCHGAGACSASADYRAFRQEKKAESVL